MRVLGLLPDRQGGGALVGCWRYPQGLGSNSLFHVDATGTITPEKLNDDKFGCGHNAMAYDRKGRLWISAEGGLYRRDTPTGDYLPIRNKEGQTFSPHANALMEHDRGMWLVAGNRPFGLWLIEEDRPPQLT